VTVSGNVKMLLLPAPQKFNTFNTFNTFDTFVARVACHRTKQSVVGETGRRRDGQNEKKPIADSR
jgi:hypothetical protein